MYVIVVIAVLLLLGLSVLAACAVQLLKTARKARERQAVAQRLDSALAQAEAEHRARTAAKKASTALTAVLPAIQPGERDPRRVA